MKNAVIQVEPLLAKLAIRMLGPVLVYLTAVPAYGQIAPDESLGSERSRVIQPRPNRIEIDGGARRGPNLFHSFREFNVGTEEIVQFRNPAGVAAIFSRVTGNNPSSILGGLGLLGQANLFLINPNGILFGEQATVNLSGSFVATTASAVQFGEGSFSAIGPDLPSALLTIDPSALLFNSPGASPGSGAVTQRGQIRVGNGETMALLGAALRIDGGQLTAPNGRIELGALQSPAQIGLTNPAPLSLQFPVETQLGDVQLQNQAVANVAAQGAGSIVIQAGNLTLNDSTLRAGVNQPSSLTGPELGSIALDVTGTSRFSNAKISNIVPLSTAGNSGDIVIRTGSLRAESSLIEATNLGFGQAGQIQMLAAGEIVLNGPETRVRTATNRGLAAEAGDIRIQAQSLALTGGARLISSTFGQGDAGDITIIAPSLVLAGSDSNRLGDRLGSGLFSTVERTATGNGGAITIQTDQLIVRDGASITARSLGVGNSGRIVIRATGAVRLSGTSRDPDPIPSGLFSSIESGATGRGGSIQIQAASLWLEDSAQIQANLLGAGASGNVVIRVAEGVTLDGATQTDAGSAIFTNVGAPDAAGQGGDIRITANSLRLLNGAQLVSSTQGQGDAGTVRLRVRETISLDQGASIFTNVLPTAVGSGGTIELRTGSLVMQEGAQIASASAGQGSAGDILVTARDTVSLSNTETERFPTVLQSSIQDTSIGRGGNIVVQTRQLTLENSQINAGTLRAAGRGGNIAIQAGRLELDRSQITTQSDQGGNAGEITAAIGERLTATDSNIITSATQASGGRISLNAGNGTIQLLGDSDIRTEVTGGQGGAGDIQLTADVILAFGDSDILAFANERGGQIQLDAPIFFGESYQPTSPDSNPGELDRNNSVDVNANARVPGDVTLPDTSFIQNSLADLPASALDTESLLANSCIARTPDGGTFLVTGSGGLPPNRPGSAAPSAYPTGEVRASANWQPGDPIVEPQGVYRLPNGELVMLHECSESS